jgi:hypothetical protein
MMDTAAYKDLMSVFRFALRSAESQRQYPRRFKVVLDFLSIPGSSLEEQAAEFVRLAKNPGWFERSMVRFLTYQKERAAKGEISDGTIGNYYKATKLFCEMVFDSPVANWKRLARGLPRARKFALDRAPTVEEIRRLCEYVDRRIRPIVYLMASSGVRVGAFDTLQWGHIRPIYDKSTGDILAAKVIVYPGDPREEYFTFCTSEAFNELKSWMDFREMCREKIGDESWVIRDVWKTSGMDYGAKFGCAQKPNKLASSAIKRILERALWEQGLRRPLAPGVKYHEWKAAMISAETLFSLVPF